MAPGAGSPPSIVSFGRPLGAQYSVRDSEKRRPERSRSPSAPRTAVYTANSMPLRPIVKASVCRCNFTMATQSSLSCCPRGCYSDQLCIFTLGGSKVPFLRGHSVTFCLTKVAHSDVPKSRSMGAIASTGRPSTDNAHVYTDIVSYFLGDVQKRITLQYTGSSGGPEQFIFVIQ